ncbi:MAG: peptidoglycan DD-metalloendopeptidase family protein [Acidobacteriota bacterium]|nr:peptidoglycan DD-metalloendopeptidase family protein [Acidobacteriota bacterium]
MFLRRNFTVMIVPDARGGLRRYHLSGRQLLVGAAVLAVVAMLAAATPLLMLRGARLSRTLASVQAERDDLAARTDEIDASMRELRQRLDAFERRTSRLATLAGLDLPATAGQGQGQAIAGEALDLLSRAEMARGETGELLDRSRLLSRRLDTVEEVLGEQTDMLSRTPSILPVHGLIGSGFSWRRDPFTGRRQFHHGLDIAAPEGTPVYAPADGIVVKTERNGGYGRVLTSATATAW